MLCYFMGFRKVAYAVGLMASVSRASAVECKQDLEDALSYCNAPATQALLDSYPAQKSCESRNGQPLHLVSQFFCSHIGDDCFNSFQVLLEAGADPNAKHPETGMTALHKLMDEFGEVNACRGGDDLLKRGLSLLIAFGADSQAEDNRRRSVVELARRKGASQDIIDLLEGKTETAGDDSASAAGGHADEDEDDGIDGEENENIVVVVVVAGVVVFLMLVCAFAYIMKRSRDKGDTAAIITAAKGVASTASTTSVQTTTSTKVFGASATGSQEIVRAASDKPAPMIIMATSERE